MTVMTPTVTQRMQELAESARPGKPKVALDTCCVQYYISNPPSQPWADCLDPVFRAGLDGKVDLYVSTVVLSELLARVHFDNRHRAGFDAELDLLAILNRHFQILDVDGDVARAAGRLRGNYVPESKMALDTPDALIGATSITNGHTLFVTNDARLYNALPEDICIFLKDAALEWLQVVFPATCLKGFPPVRPSRRGIGLPVHALLASLELCSVKPDPAATWERLLNDALTVASALGKPCLFLILAEKDGRKWAMREVLFWHSSLTDGRTPKRVLRHLKDHLDVTLDRGAGAVQASLTKVVRGFVFTSLSREREIQRQPGFASKTNHQREADALGDYLAPLWAFREAFSLPGTSWLLCEDGVARELDGAKTTACLKQAKNVLGWKDER